MNPDFSWHCVDSAPVLWRKGVPGQPQLLDLLLDFNFSGHQEDAAIITLGRNPHVPSEGPLTWESCI